MVDGISQQINELKVVPEGYHRYFLESKLRLLLKLIGGE